MKKLIACGISTCLIALIGLPLSAYGVELPDSEEEKEKLSGRQIRILRRQMSSREKEAAAAFKNAETAFLVGQYDKAIEEFLAVGREYGDTSYRMRAVLRVGDVYYRQEEYERAISYYQRALRVPSEPWWPPESQEDYARASYMIGVCYFDQGSYNPMFAHFRRFVKKYPQSQFVDQAYNFIGRANMKMERYGQAIEAFQMVGTTNIQKKTGKTIAPGDKLYVRMRDEDVGIAQKEGRVAVRISTESGDEEMVYLESLGLGSAVFLGTIKTRLGRPRRTRALDEAYSASIQQQIDDWLASASEMDKQAAETKKKLAKVKKKLERARRRLEDGSEEDTQEKKSSQADKKLKAIESEYEEVKKRLANLQTGAEKLRKRAYGRLTQAYQDIEKILERWDVAQLQKKGKEGETEEEDKDEKNKENDQEASDSLSNVFTPEQIAEVRRNLEDTSTNPTNYGYRKAVLEYWHQQLLREYKTLDLTGNDTITIEYLDQHGSEKDEVVRTDKLTIASDASIACLGPDMETLVHAVIYGDDVRIRVKDPDMDRSDKRDTVEVTVASVKKKEKKKKEEGEKGTTSEETGPSVQVLEMGREEEQSKPVMAPENAPSVTLSLKETGSHTGAFTGTMSTIAESSKSPVSKLKLSPARKVRIAYADEKTSSHDGSWVEVVTAKIVPGSEGEQEVIKKQESKLDLQSELEKGIALGKLARVYKDLGLRAEATQTFDDALEVVQKVARSARDTALGEEATYQMWDLYFASGQEEAAVEACNKLIRTFPESPLADNALLIMAKAEKRPRDAVQHLKRLINKYPESPLAPEAQYRMAVMKQEMGRFSVSAYETVTNKWPGNNFAAKSLLKLAEYYVEKRDYQRAKDYLERITLDFPDFSRLDKTTYMRGVCAYRMGDTQKAYRLMHEVLEKYPGTSVAKSATKIVKLLSKKLQKK